jgi:hypothetical protein
MSDDRRVFSEQDVGDIVRRAAELQEQSSERSLTYKPGITREQLERVAQEVGVDAEFLHKAISEHAELGAQGGKRPFTLLPTEERVVEGELDPANFDLILSQVKARGSRNRPARQIGRSLEAQVWTGAGLASLHVTSRNQRTRIRLKSFPLFELMGTLYPAFIATAVGGSILASSGHLGAAAAVAAGAMTSAAVGLRFWMRRSVRALRRLADKVDRITSEEVARQPAPLPAAATEPEKVAVPEEVPRRVR